MLKTACLKQRIEDGFHQMSASNIKNSVLHVKIYFRTLQFSIIYALIFFRPHVKYAIKTPEQKSLY
jgi:hypothetical protein